MSSQCETAGKHADGEPMGVFGRYLTVWAFLRILECCPPVAAAPARTGSVG